MADIIHIEEPLLRGILKVAPLKGSYSGPARNVTSDDMLQPLKDIIDICGTNPSSIEFSTNSQSSEESGRTAELTMTKDLLGRVRTIDMEFEVLKKEQYQPLHDFFMNLTENTNYSNVLSVYVPVNGGSTEEQTFTSSFGFNIYCTLSNVETGWKGVVSKYISLTSGTQTVKLTSYNNPSGAVPTDADISALSITISGSTVKIKPINGFTYNIMECDAGSSPSDEDTNQYVIWYYIEVMLPESDVPTKEIIYIGDSGFTSLGTFYKTDTKIVETQDGGYIEKKLTNIYVKNLKVPMIAKNAMSRVRFDYV